MLENSFTKVYRIRSAFEDDRDSLNAKNGKYFSYQIIKKWIKANL